MGIHDDNSAGYDGVAFFNIDGGSEGAGGELVIWEGLGKDRFKKRFEFCPRGNSVSVMRFSDGSYHSVNSPNGNWIRSNILVELRIEDQVRSGGHGGHSPASAAIT
ncbi:MAG: hypothetical protein HKN24_11545 [Acidimicrobiales bacterium]|nr:hypothetical protein [Acidimicrobiales bacterium]